MKMPNKKFIAFATSIGLSIGLLSGCGEPVKKLEDDLEIDEEDDKEEIDVDIVPMPYYFGSYSSTSNTSSSSGVVSGSKGIGSVKGGGVSS